MRFFLLTTAAAARSIKQEIGDMNEFSGIRIVSPISRESRWMFLT